MSRRGYIFLLIILCAEAVFVPSSLFAQTDSVTVIRMPFCTRENDEYCPIYYDSSLVFCSNRKNDVFVDYTTPDGRHLVDIYIVTLGKKSKWGRVTLFSEEITTPYFEGPATFTNNNTTVYYSRNNYTKKALKNNLDPNNKQGIYIADLVNGIWTNIRPFKHNNEKYHFTSPSISEDGTKLFFASDLPVGYGGMDIYCCELINGEWSVPVNLGNTINTAKNELFPFIHKSGNLYFSSSGRRGGDDLDVYVTRFSDGMWIDPFPMGKPINTKFDDFGLIVDTTGLKGYFSSNRNRSDDIFSFSIYKTVVQDTVVPVEELACDTVVETNLCYEFLESETFSLDSLPLFYTWDLGDGTVVNGVKAEHCYDKPGEYEITLSIVDTLSEDQFVKETTYYLSIEDVKQVYINSPDSCFIRDTVYFDGLKTNLDSFEISGYLWDFGDGVADSGSQVRHVFFNPGIYPVKLVLTSLPDSSGTMKKACGIKNVKVNDTRLLNMDKIFCENTREWDSCYIFFEGGVNPNLASMEYEWDYGDGNKQKGVQTEHCYKDTGQYSINLNVIDMITGDVFKNITSYELFVGFTNQLKFRSADTCYVDERAVFDQIEVDIDDFTVKDFLWVFSDGTVEYGEQVSKQFSVPGSYSVRLIASGIKESTGEAHDFCIYRNFVVKHAKL